MSQFSSDELFRLDEIDRLRAENAKSRADSINLKTAYSELENADRLIAKLRAENEELFEANGKLAYLNADNEQLRVGLERMIAAWDNLALSPEEEALLLEARTALTNEQKP